VFVREDATKKPLQPPYSGPHEVINKPNERLYTVRINGKDSNISTERLKPAHLPETETNGGTESSDPHSEPPQATIKKYNSLPANAEA